MSKTSHSVGQSCQVCGKQPPIVAPVMARLVRPAVVDVIKKAYPEWSQDSFICEDDLNRFRYEYVHSLVLSERGEVSDLEKEVLDSISRHDILSRDVDQEDEEDLAVGQRLSDRISHFGGSWSFILIFGCVLAAWIAVNSLALLFGSFDPYPYILLNLILSCLAAIQAPVIMMSQNRQETKDRTRAAHDYQINLKAELEIRQLHQKIDHLLSHQWERIAEIQEVQLELLTEMRGLARTSNTAEPTDAPVSSEAAPG